MPDFKNEKETILGPGTSFKGRMIFHSALTIKGYYEGEIDSDGHIVVDDHAVVNAQMSGEDIEILGQVTGNITASDSIKLTASGKLFGNISAKVLTIEQGATYKGRVSMLENIDSIDVFSASPDQLKRLVLAKGKALPDDTDES